jgi:hypothetical protein
MPGKLMTPFSRRQRLRKKARRGFRGYPIGTIAFYGRDDQVACKVAVGVVMAEGQGPEALNRWWSEDGDVRHDEQIARAICEFLEHHGVRSTVMADRIMGCPHEEGKDYPDGEACPECPFWAGRDRFTGKIMH